jgi:hypothetical protein
MLRAGVTLQVNLAPTDLPHARWILPHQLRTWADQVDEIVLTLDLHRSRNRYGTAWLERLPGLRGLIAECMAAYPSLRTHDVDYSEESQRDLSRAFFGGERIPTKDYAGAPFFAYFAGLAECSTQYAFHMDSDMLYGGGSRTWVAEAVSLMQQRPDLLACNPLPGPPALDGRLRSQILEPEPLSTPAFRTPHVSTRLFLIDLARFAERIGALRLRHPGRLHALQARLEDRPPFDTAERTISAAMEERGLVRIDFLGDPPGAWAIHPPFRSQHFYYQLPGLIQRVEAGDVPEAQRGRHDVDDSLMDWSGARQPRWRRLIGHAALIAARLRP